jgi:serine/threonine protein kinase
MQQINIQDREYTLGEIERMAEQIGLEGQKLGNYQLGRLLGRGGFADVYLGYHARLNRQAAVKVLYASLTPDEIAAFQQEAQIIAALDHPHIVRVLDFDVQNGIPFLIMDYLPNGTLRQRYPQGEQLPLSVIVEYVQQLASALQYAHDQRLIHRDVKPENMLLDKRGEAVLSDFGIAAIDHSTSSRTGQLSAGTIPYMAPEQIESQARIASDQYALGIVVYEWLSGKRPFNGSPTEIGMKHLLTPPPSLHEKMPQLPMAVEQIVFKALAKKPEQRFANIQDFAEALSEAAKETPLPSRTSVFPIVADASGDVPDSDQESPLQLEKNTNSSSPPLSSAFTGPLQEDDRLVEQKTTGKNPSLAGVSNVQTLKKARRKWVKRASIFSLCLAVLSILVATMLILGPISQGTKTPKASAANHVPVLPSQSAATSLAAGPKTPEASHVPVLSSRSATASPVVASSPTTLSIVAPTPTTPSVIAPTATTPPIVQTNDASSSLIPVGQQPIVNDPLVDNSQGYAWDTGEDAEGTGSCNFVQGQYYLLSARANVPIGVGCNTEDAKGTFSNFVYQIKMTILQGISDGNSEAGPTFRVHDSGLQYQVSFDANGYWSVVTDSTSLSNSTNPFPYFHTGVGQPNYITIQAIGSSIRVQVNGHDLGSYTDSSDSSGFIGAEMSPGSSTGQVAFSDVRVWQE